MFSRFYILHTRSAYYAKHLGDEIARDAAEFNSMPPSWLNPKAEVARMREQTPEPVAPDEAIDETLAGPLSEVVGA